MKNLQNFGVQELNAEELITIDGGGRLRWIRRILEAAIAFGEATNHIYEEQAAKGVDISPVY